MSFMRALWLICGLGAIVAAPLTVAAAFSGNDRWDVFAFDTVGLAATAIVLRYFDRRKGAS